MHAEACKLLLLALAAAIGGLSLIRLQLPDVLQVCKQ
jgi:hypothetical protein